MAHPTTRISTTLPASLRYNSAVLARALPRARRGELRAIHRVRVATRRLREALLLEPEDESKDRLVRDLRRITKALGPIREIDVARQVLKRHAARGSWATDVVARVDEECKRLRDRALSEGRDALSDLDVKDLRERLNEFADMLEASPQGRSGTSRTTTVVRLRERARLVVGEIDEVGTLYAPAALHRVRIASKKLRYLIELAGEAEAGTLRSLKRLQRDLGNLHDAQVLQMHIQALAADTKDRGLVSSLTGIDHALEARCREWHARILKNLPGISRLARAVSRDLPGSLAPREVSKPVRMRSARETKSHKKRIA